MNGNDDDNSNSNSNSDNKNDEDFAVVYDNDDGNNNNNGDPSNEDYGDNTHKATNNDSDDSPAAQAATFWSDEKGNLKYVNLVVRYPCCIFCTQLVAVLAITVLLMVIIAAQGQPFSDPETESDLSDVRSIQYDSLRLAQEQVEEDRRLALQQVIPRQSELADYTYWIFEAQTPQGCFASNTSIAAMKEAFDLFWNHQQFDEYCLLIYPPNNTMTDGNNAAADDDDKPYCDLPLTALTFYYAQEWNEALVDEVLTELKVPGNIELFNSLALCVTLNIFCDLIDNGAGIDAVPPDDVAWVLQLDAKLKNITASWNMKGKEVVPVAQATELAAYLKLVDTYKGLVDFGYDKGFSVENQVSMYSRGIVLWGGPLQQSQGLSTEEREDQDEEDSEQRRE